MWKKMSCIYISKPQLTQRAKSRGFRGESPGIVVASGGNPRGNLGCNRNENSYRNSWEIFKWDWNEREVSPNLWTFEFTKRWHQINTGIFSHNWDPSYVIKLHFEIFEGSTREISTRKYPQGFHRERRRKYPPRKFPFISTEFPQGNDEEISAGMIPWNSPINPRGNLGDVMWMACPLGMQRVIIGEAYCMVYHNSSLPICLLLDTPNCNNENIG